MTHNSMIDNIVEVTLKLEELKCNNNKYIRKRSINVCTKNIGNTNEEVHVVD